MSYFEANEHSKQKISMQHSVQVKPSELLDLLLNVATHRPVFIWGPPGIGKTSIVQKFANDLGLECVSLLGSQLAPEDLIGIPKIENGVSKFFPPAQIVREQPYVLLLDDLNSCSLEIQTAFYSLINEQRVGSYQLPKGSIVIGAGNRKSDAIIVKQMSSALINRMLHVELRVCVDEWLAWATQAGIHEYVTSYIQTRPDHLVSMPPKKEETFSTPRSWHILSDSLKSFNGKLSPSIIEVLAHGTLTPSHALNFRAFIKNLNNKYTLEAIMDGKERWPRDPKDRDVLYFLANAFRSQLLKSLPEHKEDLNAKQKEFIHKAKALLRDLTEISYEMGQLVVVKDGNSSLPDWFVTEIVRDLPKLAQNKV